jgi:hypothetical protein
MQSVAVPDLPLQTGSMDIMEVGDECRKKSYLITVDHNSDLFEIDEVRDLRSETALQKCKRIFTTYGIPETVVCDNGTQFVQFAKIYEFKISFCSPYHKEGNGKAEATDKVAKLLIKKCQRIKEDIHLALLTHRNEKNQMQRFISKRDVSSSRSQRERKDYTTKNRIVLSRS